MKDLKVFEVQVSPWQYFWRTYIILASDEKDAEKIGLEMAATPTHKAGFDVMAPHFQIEVKEIKGPFERGSLLFSYDFKFREGGSSDYR